MIVPIAYGPGINPRIGALGRKTNSGPGSRALLAANRRLWPHRRHQVSARVAHAHTCRARAGGRCPSHSLQVQRDDLVSAESQTRQEQQHRAIAQAGSRALRVLGLSRLGLCRRGGPSGHGRHRCSERKGHFAAYCCEISDVTNSPKWGASGPVARSTGQGIRLLTEFALRRAIPIRVNPPEDQRRHVLDSKRIFTAKP